MYSPKYVKIMEHRYSGQFVSPEGPVAGLSRWRIVPIEIERINVGIYQRLINYNGQEMEQILVDAVPDSRSQSGRLSVKTKD